MDPINPHDTAVHADGKWYAVRGSATEARAASHKAVRRFCTVAALIGAAIGIYVITFMESVSLLSGVGIFLVGFFAGAAIILGGVLIESSRQGEQRRGPRGAIPGAVLSDRAAHHLTPETRDRLALAHDQGVLPEALVLVEQDARRVDTRAAQEIMHAPGVGNG